MAEPQSDAPLNERQVRTVAEVMFELGEAEYSYRPIVLTGIRSWRSQFMSDKLAQAIAEVNRRLQT